MRLTIAQTWDGQPLPERLHTHLDVRFDGDALVMLVEGPFNGDRPPPGMPGPTPKLWEHEVVELFIVGPAERYLEIELSPFGHHLVLQLEGVRNIVASQLPVAYATAWADDRWKGEVRVPRSYLPVPALTCNAYRVAGVGPARAWHALAAVPGERPDFHRLAHFVPWPLRD